MIRSGQASGREIARAARKSPGWITQFLDGATPYAATLDELEEGLNRLDAGEGGGQPDQEALNLLGADFDQLAKYIGGVPASDPVEARLRKLDVLEGLRRVFSAYGPVPGSWYRLKEMVEKGEL